VDDGDTEQQSLLAGKHCSHTLLWRYQQHVPWLLAAMSNIFGPPKPETAGKLETIAFTHLCGPG